MTKASNYVFLLLITLWLFHPNVRSADGYNVIERSRGHIVYNEKANTFSLPVNRTISFQRANYTALVSIHEVEPPWGVGLEAIVLEEHGNERKVVERYIGHRNTFDAEERVLRLNSVDLKLVFLDPTIIEAIEGWTYSVQDEPLSALIPHSPGTMLDEPASKE